MLSARNSSLEAFLSRATSFYNLRAGSTRVDVASDAAELAAVIVESEEKRMEAAEAAVVELQKAVGHLLFSFCTGPEFSPDLGNFIACYVSGVPDFPFLKTFVEGLPVFRWSPGLLFSLLL